MCAGGAEAMGDAGRQVGTKGSTMEAEAAVTTASKAGQTVVVAMKNLAQAVDHWQQAISFVSKKRYDTEKQSANLVKQMNRKIQEMEKRLEQGLVETFSGNEIKKEVPDVQTTSTPQSKPIAVNQSTSLQGRHIADARISSGVKRAGCSIANLPCSSTTPTKLQRTFQDDVTPGTHFLLTDSQTSPPFSNPPPPLKSARLLPDQFSLLSAVRNGKTGYCLTMLKQDINLDFKDKLGNTLLHLAAKIANVKILEALLDSEKLQVDAEDSFGQTALHVAASIQNGDACVNILLAYSADVNKRDHKGDTPLHCAARNGHDKIVRKLLRNPAILIIPNNRGEKPNDVARDDVIRGIFEAFNEISASAEERLDASRFLEISEDLEF